MIVFEDEDLLVANKPAGLNTHAPSPFAGEGLYEWLRNSDARRAALAIIHRLDKDTSGLIVFGKTSAANRSLTQQFEERAVRKKARWLLKYWGGNPNANLLLMPATRHPLVHLNEISRMNPKLRRL